MLLAVHQMGVQAFGQAQFVEHLLGSTGAFSNARKMSTPIKAPPLLSWEG